MTEAQQEREAIVSGFDHAFVQQLHEERHGPRHSAVAGFPHAHRSAVRHAQERSKAGLCKPGPLANGFEGLRGHSVVPCQLVVAVKPVLALLVQPFGFFMVAALGCGVCVGQIAIAAILSFKNALAERFRGHSRLPCTQFVVKLFNQALVLCGAKNQIEGLAQAQVAVHHIGKDAGRNLGVDLRAVGHFILPCPVEHRSVADETVIGSLFL